MADRRDGSPHARHPGLCSRGVPPRHLGDGPLRLCAAWIRVWLCNGSVALCAHYIGDTRIRVRDVTDCACKFYHLHMFIFFFFDTYLYRFCVRFCYGAAALRADHVGHTRVCIHDATNCGTQVLLSV